MRKFTLQRVLINVTIFAIALGLLVTFPPMVTRLPLLLLSLSPTLIVIAIACYFSKNRARTIVVVALGGLLGWLLAPSVERGYPMSFWDRFLDDYMFAGPMSATAAVVLACVEWRLSQQFHGTLLVSKVRSSRRYVVGFFGIVLFTAIIFLVWPQSATQTRIYTVYAIVSDAQCVRVGTPVMRSGKVVGSIRDIQITDGVSAVLELYLDSTNGSDILQSDELVLDATHFSGGAACLVFQRQSPGRRKPMDKLQHGDVVNVRLTTPALP